MTILLFAVFGLNCWSAVFQNFPLVVQDCVHGSITLCSVTMSCYYLFVLS